MYYLLTAFGRNLEPQPPAPMIPVFATPDLEEAHWVRGLLEAEGIPAEVRGGHLQTIKRSPHLLESMEPIVWILDLRQREAAQVVIDRYLRGGDEAPAGPLWVCPACGEELEPQFDRCWNCGTGRPPE
jgi:hypothetical protein